MSMFGCIFGKGTVFFFTGKVYFLHFCFIVESVIKTLYFFFYGAGNKKYNCLKRFSECSLNYFQQKKNRGKKYKSCKGKKNKP